MGRGGYCRDPAHRSAWGAGRLARMSARAPTAEGLARRRNNGGEENAKRIHVVVRVRPLNMREIKEDAKVQQ